MSDTEPSPLPQELIGVPKNDTAQVEGLLKDIRTRYKECLAPILVEREKVDPRVIQFEKQLHDLNERRAKFYGREYNPPEILYVDKISASQHREDINGQLKTESFSDFDESAAHYHQVGNFIVIFINSFDDIDVDSYIACTRMKHEMNHAGSVVKHRAYPDDNGPSNYRSYRVGAKIDPKETDSKTLGLVLDEGHHAIEDQLDQLSLGKYKKDEPFLLGLPKLKQLFPEADSKLQALIVDAILLSGLTPGQMLLSYRTVDNEGILLIDHAEKYDDYKHLMIEIYRRKPELYKLAVDFIYGDKMVAFAREIDLTFGKGFFRKLMAAENREAAKKLASELK